MLLIEKTHMRSCFYKYVSFNVAEIVLKNNTLRWSSPLRFNDPFDVPRELAYGLEPNEIMEAIINQHIRLYRNSSEDISKLQPSLKLLVEKVREANSDDLVDKIKAGLMGSLLENTPSSINLDLFRNHWKKLIKEMRVLCLCESNDKTSMWYHYADKYQGAVIEFLCTDDVDAPWRIARPVDYIDEVHLVSTPDGWAKLLTMELESAIQDLFDKSVYTKTTDWAYEREWRLVSFKLPEEDGDYSDYGFDRLSIGNLYLGPLMPKEEKIKLINLANSYPRMNIYETRIGMDRKISFHKLAKLDITGQCKIVR